MFTGIIEGMGQVKTVSKSKRGAKIALGVYLGSLSRGLKRGDSVCINGACLTVTKRSRGQAEFEIVAETIRRTNLGQVTPSDKVNIERSIKIGERLEGHFVLGHVDGTGVVEEIEKLASETRFWIKMNRAIARSVVSKGSIAIDGVSLTLVDIKGDRVSVSLIPHTLSVTTLGLRQKGDIVNIETDILGKYVLGHLPKN